MTIRPRSGLQAPLHSQQVRAEQRRRHRAESMPVKQWGPKPWLELRRFPLIFFQNAMRSACTAGLVHLARCTSKQVSSFPVRCTAAL